MIHQTARRFVVIVDCLADYMSCCIVGSTKTGSFENAEGRKRSASLKRQMETTGEMNQYDRDRPACGFIIEWRIYSQTYMFLNTKKSEI